MTELRSPAPPLSNNERASLAISYVILSLMLVCFAVPIIEFTERAASNWSGRYLLPVIFIIALEAFVSWRTARLITFPSLPWLYYRATEAVVLLGGLKLYVYALTGWDKLLTDLPRWQRNFLTFLEGEYLFGVILVVVIWLLATRLANSIGDLEGDEILTADVRDSQAQSDRAAARQRLLGDIFLIGSLMLVITAILRQDLGYFGLTQPPLQTGLLNVVIYFFLGLVVLAQSQFAVLRARWIIDHIPIHFSLAGRWALYSALLLLVCALLVIFLPTRYSIGFLDTINAFISILSFLISVLLFLVFLPIQFLMKLLGMGEPAAVAQPPPELDFNLPTGGGGGFPLSELFKSIVFWGLFLFIIGFSVYYYLRQRTDLLARLPRLKFPVFNFKFKFKFPSFSRRPPLLSPLGYINLRRLSARDRVRYYYRALLQRSDVPRAPSQTPFEYRQSLSHLPPDEIESLTKAFVEAQYTRHEITPTLVGIARQSWENLKKVLRSLHRP